MEDLRVDLSDPNKEDNVKLSNLVDPVLLSIFMERVKDPHEKRNIRQLFDLLLSGR